MSDRTKEEARQIAPQQTAHVLIIVLLIESYYKIEESARIIHQKKCLNYVPIHISKVHVLLNISVDKSIFLFNCNQNLLNT